MHKFTIWRILQKFFIIITSLLLFLPLNSIAQTAEIPFHIETYNLTSGIHSGPELQGGKTYVPYSRQLKVSDAPWLRIIFEDANLGKNSYIIITSKWDGKWQKLDATSIEQWQLSSAYFNGNQVEIKLHVAPFDRNIFFSIKEVIVGEYIGDYNIIESQCGPTDDRISSNQPATGRLMAVGCTAWIIPNGNFVTAGHCLENGGINVVQFQVPPSLPDDTPQNPGPEDQYAVNLSTKVFIAGDVGNDWGTFEVFSNSVTGLLPKQAQDAFWLLAQDYGADSIRITGYGVDTGIDNQTQQTHIGPNAGSSGTTMRYATDTQGGNSGSPVIDEATGNAVGVHTHAGCNGNGGNNHGTSLLNTAFWAAVEQGGGNCAVQAASNPNPVQGKIGVSSNIPELTWDNGIGAISNELYFGTEPGNLTLVQSGSLATSWTITEAPLSYNTIYYWRVVEYGDTCFTHSPTWSFTTERDPAIMSAFIDDFEGGTENWVITNDGGSCDWTVFAPPYPNSYTLPLTSSGQVLGADSDECGTGTTHLSTSTLNFVTDASQAPGYNTVFVEWDNDWKIVGVNDEAHVEYSLDGGNSWSTLVSWIGVDQRNTHEVHFVQGAGLQSDIRFRLRTVQPGWDWWWVVDNFVVYLTDPIPVELTSFDATLKDNNVVLSWVTATETNNMGFEIHRSSNGSDYSRIAFVEGYGTVTETNDYTYSDKNLEVGTYTYILKQIDFDGTSEFSNAVEVEVLVPDVFALEQNYPNPFNPITKIKFILAEDSKIKLAVFDILGQEVVTLIKGNLSAGSHNIDFNAASAAGGINSGVYFYKIDATGIDGTNFTSVKKMILTK
jgi:hypothetical protein